MDTIWCLACGKPVSEDWLSRNGVPKELLSQVRLWHPLISRLDQTLANDASSGASDAQFVEEWKELRQKTAFLVTSLWKYVPTRADIDSDVFCTRPDFEWHTDTILQWRNWKRVLAQYKDYGVQLGAHWAAAFGDRAKALSKLPLALPTEVPNENRDWFRQGFKQGVTFYLSGIQSHSTCVEELRLAQRLGVRPAEEP